MFKIKDKIGDEDDSATGSRYFKSKTKTALDEKSASTVGTTKSSNVTTSSQLDSRSTSSQPSIGSREVAERRQSSSDALNPTRKASFGNTLAVNSNQSANKLLKHLRIPYQMTDGISPAHYLMHDSCCALFLSLKYHIIYPEYIYDKLNQLGNAYQLKVLLVLIDHIEYQSALKELTKLAIRSNCTLLLAWSYEEAANHIENYRNFADKSADIIAGKQNTTTDHKGENYQCLVEALTSVKSINKTDAVSLISMFDTFENIVKSDDDQLIVCPGMAALKAQRLRQFFNKPFIRAKD